MKDDLENTTILFEKGKLRGGYIHLFDGLERAIDLILASKGYKPETRKAREAGIERFFGHEVLRKFRGCYFKRKGGMYDDMKIIEIHTIRSAISLFIELKKIVEAKVKKIIDEALEKIKF